MRYALIIPIFCLLVTGCEKDQPPPPIRPVRAMQIEAEQQVRLHAFPGRTRAVDRVNLSFRVSGEMIDRPVFVGDDLKKGDLIARLDPKDFEVKLANAEGRLEKVEADLRFAGRDYDRAVNIWKEDAGAISESLLDQKKEERNRLRGERKAVEAEVEAARDQLRYTYLRSPYDGNIVATYVENFEYVEAKQPIVRLLNKTQVEMMIDVPESMISDIPNVEKVVVRFDAIPNREFSATIKEVGQEASVTTRTYPVTLLIIQPEDTPIYSGMAGYAFLYSPKFSEEGFLLPTSSLMTDSGEQNTYVWLVNLDTSEVEKQEVEVGKLTSRGMVITAGLVPGEWVVTSGVHYLKEGQEVRILPVILTPSGQQMEIPLSSSTP